MALLRPKQLIDAVVFAVMMYRPHRALCMAVLSSVVAMLACLAGPGRAHVDRLEADMLALAAAEPVSLLMRIGYGDVDRLFTCG